MPDPPVSPPQLLADLKRAFPRQPVDDGTLRVYLRELTDIPAGVLEIAVRTLIRTSEFFPTVRAIRETAVEHVLGLPGEAAALEQINRRIEWAREAAEGSAPDRPPMNDLVLEALQLVGGIAAVRASTDPGVIRGQFLRLYRELRAAAIRDGQVGDPLVLGTAKRQIGP